MKYNPLGNTGLMVSEIGVDSAVDLKVIADSCNIVPTAYKKMTHEEIFEIFKECL